MRKYVVTFLCVALLAGGVTAQKAPKLPKSVKDAKKALNAGDLGQALQLVNTALEDGTTAGMAEAWSVKGDILASMVSSDNDNIMKASITNAAVDVKYPTAGAEAFTAYQTAFSKSTGEKDKGEKASISGLVKLAPNLANVGSTLFGKGDYENAFHAFNTILQSRDLLLTKGNKSIYAKDAEHRQIQFNAAVSAKNAGKPELADDAFQGLVDANYPHPSPYVHVFNKLIETDEDAAFAALDKGKKACEGVEGMNTSDFLFAEINYFLKKGDYKKLENRLQAAIEAQPDNVSLYYALGTVYDGLFQEADKAGDKEKSQGLFDEAKKYYEKTLELNDKHADASYNIGALYYNQAANLNAAIKEYDSDLSNEGIRKYNTLKGEQKKLMETSRPFFERALEMNPKHRGSMKALQGIAAYNNDTTTANKYKEMLEAGE